MLWLGVEIEQRKYPSNLNDDDKIVSETNPYKQKYHQHERIFSIERQVILTISELSKQKNLRAIVPGNILGD